MRGSWRRSPRPPGRVPSGGPHRSRPCTGPDRGHKRAENAGTRGRGRRQTREDEPRPLLGPGTTRGRDGPTGGSGERKTVPEPGLSLTIGRQRHIHGSGRREQPPAPHDPPPAPSAEAGRKWREGAVYDGPRELFPLATYGCLPETPEMRAVGGREEAGRGPELEKG